jgi:D-lactate dehydrogenase
MKVGFFGVDQQEKDFVLKRNKDSEIEPVFFEESLDENNSEIAKPFKAISVFVGSELNKKALKKLNNLEYIVTRSTGFDHIDLKYCKKNNILVSNVPNYGEHTVAEYAFALILNISRRVYEGYNQIREEGDFSVKGLQGFDLKDKTIGIIGTGSIGRNVVKIANGFEMNILLSDVVEDKKFAKKYDAKYVDLDKLLSESDIVSLHVPYLKATHHLINKKNIKKMKEGAYLINTSRGAIVETEALVEAIKSNHLAGAGLDVLEEEGITRDEFGFLMASNKDEDDLKTVVENHILIDMDNVIVTPHNAFNTKEAWERILNTTVDSFINFKKGKPINLIN